MATPVRLIDPRANAEVTIDGDYTVIRICHNPAKIAGYPSKTGETKIICNVQLNGVVPNGAGGSRVLLTTK